MLEVSTPIPALRERLQLDLRPLHSALGRANSPLEVLSMCEATAMVLGGGLWVAACVSPQTRTYACGPQPVSDGTLRRILADMEQAGRAQGLGVNERFSSTITTRWRNPESPTREVSTGEYAQVDLLAGGRFSGLLRVVRMAPDTTEEPCDWEGVETIMCAAAPHIVLCLQKEACGGWQDPLTGLCTPSEFRERLEREVERCRVHPCEVALVIMELRLGPDRAPGIMTDTELQVVGEVLRSTLRAADSACYLPDGRFALLLPMTSQRNALIAVARVTDRLRAHPLLPSDLECQTGVSGWTFEGASAPELFEQATCALEGAKLAGARGAFLYL